VIYINKIGDAGVVSFRGLETGKLQIQSESESVLVVHESGHSYWAALGTRDYAAARFYVLNIIERTIDGYVTRPVIDFPVKKKAS